MSSFLEELKKENAKSGMFDEFDTGVSYPIGIPMIDQQLGFKQKIRMPDGSVYEQVRIGLPAGTFSMFVGPSSSFKTATAITAGWNIVETFGEDASLIIFDAESATESQRIMDLTGVDEYTYRQRITRIDDPTKMTFDNILDTIIAIANKKASDKQRYMYNTGFKSVTDGSDIVYYIPTVIVIDSLMRLTTKDDKMEEIQGLTSGGRDAIFRGKWYRNCLAYAKKYNINIIVINHLGNALSLTPGSAIAKQLTFIPTGKNVPGGDKALYYTSSLLAFQPVNSKDQITTSEEDGYNGIMIKIAVAKSRTGPGGKTATLQYIQETGIDLKLSLMNIAKAHNAIQGRNPSCYFADEPSVKFDTRKFLEEMHTNPELIHALYKACQPILRTYVRDAMDDNMRKEKNDAMAMLRSIY